MTFRTDKQLRAAWRELAKARATLDAREGALVAECRAAAWTWRTIADEAGLTRQGIQRRHPNVG